MLNDRYRQPIAKENCPLSNKQLNTNWTEKGWSVLLLGRYIQWSLYVVLLLVY